MFYQGCFSIFSKVRKRSNCNYSRIRAAKLKIIKALTFIFVVLILILYNLIILSKFPSDGIVCFNKVISDDIPDILDDEVQPPKNGKSIFFHETSCYGSNGWVIKINSRQACAVESAAYLNPNSTIYLLYTSPIRYPNVTVFSSSEYRVLRELLKYKNIKIRRVNLKRYLENTPLQEWFYTGQLNRSSYVNSHTSDVLRFLSLWRYGGTYLDLDVVLMKSLDTLKPNFAGAESHRNVAVGILNFDHRKVGQFYANLCLRELVSHFNGDDWGHNGPGVITRVLSKVCKTNKTYAMTVSHCKGFHVLPPSAFYPIHWNLWELYFKANKFHSTLRKVNNSYAIHVWNKFSINTNVYPKQNNSAYGYISSKFCPNVYKASGDIF